MKNLMFIFLGIIPFIFMSCSQEDENEIVNENQNAAPQATTVADPLLLADVEADLIADGYVEVSEPVGWTAYNSWSGMRTVKFFEKAGQSVEVYVWPNNSDYGMHLATNDCTKEWTSPDCKASSDECDVDIVDGKVVITCCDDQVA